MKKLFIGIVCLFMAHSAEANYISYNRNCLSPEFQNKSITRDLGGGIQNGLKRNLNFYFDLTSQSIVPSITLGSPVATFFRTACSCISINSHGVISLVTSASTPRFWGGYYDETGFHAAGGILIEPGAANGVGHNKLLTSYMDLDTTDDGICDNWSSGGTAAALATFAKTQSGIGGLSNYTDIADVYLQKIYYKNVADGDNLTLWTVSDAVTGISVGDVYSVSGYYYIETNTLANGAVLRLEFQDASHAVVGTPATVTLTGTQTFSYFSVTGTAGTGATHLHVYPVYIGDVDQGEEIEIYYTFMQAEKNPVPTSYVPSARTALQRNNEYLRSPTTGNRNGAEETFTIVAMPMGRGFSNDGVSRYIARTTSPNRDLLKYSSGTAAITYPNNSDTNTCFANGGGGSINVNTSYAITVTASQSSPYAQIFIDGSFAASDTTHKPAIPVWDAADYTYFGSTTTPTLHGILLIQAIAIHNRVLTANEISNEVSILKSNIAQSSVENITYDLSFGIFTDSHYDSISSTGPYYRSGGYEKLGEAVSTWNSYGTDFNIGLGDQLNGSTDAAGDTVNLSNIDGLLDGTNSTSYILLGNHDVDKLSTTEFLDQSNHIAERFYTFTVNGVKVICLAGSDKAHASTTIDKVGGITDSDTTIPVVSTSAFNDPKHLYIGSECITYTSSDATNFYGCSRGLYGTTAVAHDNGASVGDNYFKISNTQLDWLDTELTGTDPKIICCHTKLNMDYPGIPPTGDSPESMIPFSMYAENAEIVRAKIEAASNVLGVFQGHAHANAHNVVHGIDYFSFASMAGSSLTSNAYAVAKVRITPKKVTVLGFGRQSSY